jgi:uncharacterized protein YbbC (DUF1343 family)
MLPENFFPMYKCVNFTGTQRRIVFAAASIACAFLFMACSLFHSTPGMPAYGNVKTGAERTREYLPLLQNKRVGIVANHTSIIGETHLVDSLISLGVNVKRIFTPEHGFRGTADAGERVQTALDEKTGLPLISLYGNERKPSPDDLKDLDIMIYDIQDVGVRYYTYIGTMHYVMEACAENGVPLLILDRPNPNGFYVDGPLLDMEYRSFVGMHPVTIVHGMTVAEYATMINGEGWLEGGIKADLHYVLCEDYDHLTLYRLPVNPSPNLQTQLSIYLYPSICLFEGTIVSLGRGTNLPFMVFGHPQMANTDFQFTPRSVPGATNPPLLGQTANGVDLSGIPESYFIERRALNLEWLLFAYNNTPRDLEFFNGFFNRLAGYGHLRQWIESGKTLEEITATWVKDVEDFKKVRRKYLLYDDFE